MPQPVPGDLHVSTPLSNLSIAFFQEANNFAFHQAFPVVPSDKQFDRYYEINLHDVARDEARERTSGTESVGVGLNYTTSSFACKVYAVHRDIGDQELANADAAIANLEATATKQVTEKLMIRAERLWATSYFAGSLWGTDWDGVVSGEAYGSGTVRRWDEAGSTPVEDVARMKTAIAMRSGGRKPNIAVMSAEVYAALEGNADILDRVKYTQRGQTTQEILAGLFDVEKVIVGYSTYTSTVENTAGTGTSAYILGKNFGLFYAPSSPAIEEPSAGYMFNWTGYLAGGLGKGPRVKRFEIPEIEATRIEATMAFQHKLVSSACGGIIVDVIS